MNNQEIEKKCPRCGKPFICRPNDIANCQCSKISLSDKAKQYIQEKFNNCLCINCLIEINKLKNT